ncbi:MAG: hypothetical protein K9M07_01765 [Simkaniaceae bacterium]|nr:hypothetical protein [Simkaniaceae bacterium]MCF7851949.1 hypothetical protein [Simkaniaceae bacterium]
MINDEFEELLESISTGFESNTRQNSDDIILKTYRFFSKLKGELKEASGAEKDDVLRMIKKMQEKITEYSKKSCDKVGMSEEELMRLSDDTNIFTPDQKRVLEMAKKEMLESSKVIRNYMEEKQVEHKAVEIHEPGAKKKSSPQKKKRRNEWIKS